MGLFNKKELAEISNLENAIILYKKRLEEIGGKEYFEIQKMVADLKLQLVQLEEETISLKRSISVLDNEINNKKDIIADLDDEASYQEFGFYKPKYECLDSEEYANKIKDIREQQKNMVKNKIALSFYDGWTLDGSKTKGNAMNNDNMKMVLRAFNNECDVLISKAKFNNIDKIEEKIKKASIQIDKLNSRNRISILQDYINSKLDELHLVHEYAVKKQEEKEILKEQRAQEREETKLQKEIENARKDILKEQTHYENALTKIMEQLANATEEETEKLNERITEVKSKLNEINKNMEEIDYREANKRAGYVYIISNIGAFGENIYKIGMTRRLEPMDRVDELGDASVPFLFDLHAMIFSDDAPTLEHALHSAFDDKKVNMVNGRKEFFNVTLEEIEKVVKENHDNLIEFKKVPEAIQYRETLLLKKK